MIGTVEQPLDREHVLTKLRALEGELRARGVSSLFLFGSVSRNEAALGSDVDLFFDPAPEAALSLLDVIGIAHFIEDSLRFRPDVATRRSVHPLIREEVEASAVRVY